MNPRYLHLIGGTIKTRISELPFREFDVCVCGGRDFDDWHLLDYVLHHVTTWGKVGWMLSGGARGADKMATTWATQHRIATRSLFARWKAQGRAAGPIRNAELAAELVKLPAVLVVAMPGGDGTADMIMQCNVLGLHVIDVQEFIDIIDERYQGS